MTKTTEPIKNREDVERLKDFYRVVEPNPRNYALIVVGVNSALRVSDLLALRWKHVYDFESGAIREHVEVKERKTGKQKMLALNENARDALAMLYRKSNRPGKNGWVFQGDDRWGKRPLSRSQAFRIVTYAAGRLSLGEHISCHSLRKTFGYHAWKMGVSPILLMAIYNHSSYEVTKRYLGIGQDEKDEVYRTINL